MTLDMLLIELRVYQCLLISEREIWPSSYTPDEELRHIKKALHKNAPGLRLLLRWNSWSVCPAKDLHRPYVRYAGGGQWICGMCEQLAIA